MTTNNLSGKNIVIIGGTAGIGLATAVAASGLGANVWAAGRTQAHIEPLANGTVVVTASSDSP